MKTEQLNKLLSHQENAVIIATFLGCDSRTLPMGSMLEYSVMLSKGNTIKCAVFPPKTAPGAPVAPAPAVPDWKFGQRVILTGVRVAVNKGYLNVAAESVVLLEA